MAVRAFHNYFSVKEMNAIKMLFKDANLAKNRETPSDRPDFLRLKSNHLGFKIDSIKAISFLEKWYFL